MPDLTTDSRACPRPFPEELLSGYLDRALTQGEEQQVRVHLEDCASCRQLMDELRSLRETAMTTQFFTPRDDQWDEAPRTPLSLTLRRLGWIVAVTWLTVIVTLAGWELATSPEPAWTKLLVFAGISGAALLFLSILLDRLQTWRTDRYRRVKK